MANTSLQKLTIEKFRALNNVEIEFAEHLTVICGKNGTSKSSILGIAAQIFSFDKNYVTDEKLSFEQIVGSGFKSQYSEHFRISEKFDTPGSMTVNIGLFDGYTKQNATARLELMKRRSLPRPVVRNNSTAFGSSNTSRNFTHPVIFLSLKRLYPIAARDYTLSNYSYLEDNKQQFINLTNEILNLSSSNATGTAGTISSAVAHGGTYDQESVSAGEDNVGQIVLALMSFRKLKEEYPEYKGGLLLIDEADAGLFPTAQINLLKMFDRECRKLNLQVIMTSHSPVLIQHAFDQSKQPRQKYKTVYLSNTYGPVQVMHDWSWTQIDADINTKTVGTSTGISLPPLRVYFEDREAADFFSALTLRQPLKKFTAPQPDITLGCSHYLSLIKSKIPEFAKESIICLDADQAKEVEGKNYKTVVLLPGHLPPDQLIFEHLYNLPKDDPYWINTSLFSRDMFTNIAREVLNDFAIGEGTVDIDERVNVYRQNNPSPERGKKPREIFKRFYKQSEFQKLLSPSASPTNPWKHWIDCNPAAANRFLENLKVAMHGIMKSSYSVDAPKLTAVEVSLKKE